MVLSLVGEGIDWLEHQASEGAAALPGFVTDLGAEAIGRAQAALRDLGDLPDEAIAFFADPEAYFERVVADAVAELGAEAVGALRAGAVGLAGPVLNEVGLRPLAEGIAGFVDAVAEVVDRLAAFAQCARHFGSTPFWGLSALIVGARAAGLVNRPDQIDEPFIRSLVDKVDSLPQVEELVDMLDCATLVAFEVPLPTHQPVEFARLSPNAPPSPCVYTVLERTGGPEERCYYAWRVDDLEREIDNLWPAGWRIEHLEPFVLNGFEHAHCVLSQSHADQRDWALRVGIADVVAAHRRNIADGYELETFRSYLGAHGVPLAAVVFSRRGTSRSQQAVVPFRTLGWWQFGPKAADHPDPYYSQDEHLRDEVGRARLLSVYEWEANGQAGAGGSPTRCDVVLGEPALASADTTIGWVMSPAEFASRHAGAAARGQSLVALATYTRKRRLFVAAVWRGSIHGFAVRQPERRELFGWRWEDLHDRIGDLHHGGFRTTLLSGYLA